MTSPFSQFPLPSQQPIPPRYQGLPNAATFGRLASRPDLIDPTAAQYFVDWIGRAALIDAKGVAVLRPDFAPIGIPTIPARIPINVSRPTIVKLAGDNQKGKPRAALPTPLKVRITDGKSPQPGVSVAFEVRNFGATIGGRVIASRTTNAAGEAEIGVWILGPETGSQSIEVTAAGSSDLFTATAGGSTTP